MGGREKDGGRSLAYRQPSVKVVGDTRNGTRGGGGRAGGKSWRGTDILGLSLPSAKAEDWSTENIGQGGGQEEEGEEGRRVVERWKVEKRRQ